MFVVLMFGFSIFPQAFVCEYFFCPFELLFLFALSRKEIKALSFFSIEFTIFQEFSVRLGSEMSFVTKWRLWSRKLYLLFPLKITLVSLAHPFLSLPFFIMEKLLREKNVISFLVAAICIEIFYWFHIAESFLLFFCCCRVVRSRSSVRASPSKLKEWNGMKKKNEKSRMGECHKNRNWTMLHLILSMRSHRSRMHRYLCMLKNEHPSEMYCIDIVEMWFSFSVSLSLPLALKKGYHSKERAMVCEWVRARERGKTTHAVSRST